jgi:hypothetical protein
MVTLDDYFRAHDAEGGDWRKRAALAFTPTLEANAERTVSLANQLLDAFGEWRQVVSGWRPPAYNVIVPNAAKYSMHLTCEAVDLEDHDGELDEWIAGVEGLEALKRLGLWAEHQAATKGWCHVQTKPPKSGRRIFYP